MNSAIYPTTYHLFYFYIVFIFLFIKLCVLNISTYIQTIYIKIYVKYHNLLTWFTYPKSLVDNALRYPLVNRICTLLKPLCGTVIHKHDTIWNSNKTVNSQTLNTICNSTEIVPLEKNHRKVDVQSKTQHKCVSTVSPHRNNVKLHNPKFAKHLDLSPVCYFLNLVKFPDTWRVEFLTSTDFKRRGHRTVTRATPAAYFTN